MMCCRPLRRAAPRSMPCSPTTPRVLRPRGSATPTSCFRSSKTSSTSEPGSTGIIHGIVERWNRTLLDEHFRVEGRRTWFETLEEMQIVLDQYLVEYNTKRP